VVEYSVVVVDGLGGQLAMVAGNIVFVQRCACDKTHIELAAQAWYAHQLDREE
jgi:hypothetical protein